MPAKPPGAITRGLSPFPPSPPLSPRSDASPGSDRTGLTRSGHPPQSWPRNRSPCHRDRLCNLGASRGGYGNEHRGAAQSNRTSVARGGTSVPPRPTPGLSGAITRGLFPFPPSPLSRRAVMLPRRVTQQTHTVGPPAAAVAPRPFTVPPRSALRSRCVTRQQRQGTPRSSSEQPHLGGTRGDIGATPPPSPLSPRAVMPDPSPTPHHRHHCAGESGKSTERKRLRVMASREKPNGTHAIGPPAEGLSCSSSSSKSL